MVRESVATATWLTSLMLRIFCPKIAVFSQFQVYLKITQAKRVTDLLRLNNFYPVMSYRRVRMKKKATNCCVRFGHSLWSANQLPAQVVHLLRREFLVLKLQYFLSFKHI